MYEFVSAFVTDFSMDKCNSCGNVESSNTKHKECVWYERTNNDQILENRSFDDSSKCDDVPLVEPCPYLGPCRELIFFFK